MANRWLLADAKLFPLASLQDHQNVPQMHQEGSRLRVEGRRRWLLLTHIGSDQGIGPPDYAVLGINGLNGIERFGYSQGQERHYVDRVGSKDGRRDAAIGHSLFPTERPVVWRKSQQVIVHGFSVE